VSRSPLLAVLAAGFVVAGCSATTTTRSPEPMQETPSVLSTPAPEGGARFDVTHRPTRDEVGLTPGARTIVVGKSTEPPFTATLVTEAGEVSVQARDVAIDSDRGDEGPVAQLVVHLVLQSRGEREDDLRQRAAVLGVDPASVDTFLDQAAQASSSGASDTISTNLRGGTTGGGTLEIVVRYNPKEDTIFENVQVTWPT
jgi:hypothetical protein